MSTTIEGRARELLEEPNFFSVATLRSDGSIHLVPTWGTVEDDRVILNSAEGRVWPSNLRRDPRVTVTVQNRENPYEYVQIRGRLVEETQDGADENIDDLAEEYLGQRPYPFRQPGEVRIIFKIEPEWINHYGG